MTNYKKLSWGHRVTEPELPLFLDLITKRAKLLNADWSMKRVFFLNFA